MKNWTHRAGLMALAAAFAAAAARALTAPNLASAFQSARESVAASRTAYSAEMTRAEAAEAALNDSFELVDDETGRPFALAFRPEDLASVQAELDGDVAALLQKAGKISGIDMLTKPVRVNVSLKTQSMVVERPDGPPLHFPVSSGRPGHKTVTGTFDMEKDESGRFRAYENYHSHTYNNALMPYAMFFYEGFATHSAINEFDALGRTPRSHGCVRMAPKDAAALFALVKLHGRENVGFWVHD